MYLKGTFTMLILIIVISFLIIGTFFYIVIFPKTNLGKEYWKEYTKRKCSKKRKQYIYVLQNNEYLGRIPKYYGKEVFRVSSNIDFIFWLLFIPFIIFLCAFNIINSLYSNDGNLDIIILYCMFFFCFFVFAENENLFIRMNITKDEIIIKSLIKKHIFKWKSIKTIGISISPDGNNTIYGRLYFSKRVIKKPISFMCFN